MRKVANIFSSKVPFSIHSQSKAPFFMVPNSQLFAYLSLNFSELTNFGLNPAGLTPQMGNLANWDFIAIFSAPPMKGEEKLLGT